MTTTKTSLIEKMQIEKCKADSYAIVLSEEIAKLVEERIDPTFPLALTKITFWSRGEEVEVKFGVETYKRTETVDGVQWDVTEYSRNIVSVNKRDLSMETPPPYAPWVDRERA